MFGLPPLRRTYEAALRDLSSNRPAVRASAAQDLGSAGDANPRAAADALVPLLDDESAEVRGAALSSLGILGARHALDAIAARLDDSDATVRQVAVIAVSELGGERAAETLRAALKHDRADVRYQALLGLTTVDPRAGFEASLEALRSDDVWIAAEAATQLGLLLSPATPGDAPAFSRELRDLAAAALARHLEGGPERVALSAAMALGQLGDRRAAPALAAFVRGETRVEGQDTEELLAGAIELLGVVGGDEARAALEPLAWRRFPSLQRALARAALARLGDPRAAGEIVAQLRSPWAGRRNAAVRLAAGGRVRAAVDDLVALLGKDDAEPFAVVDALGAIGGPKAVEALERVARAGDASELRDAAREALAAARREEGR